MEPDADRSPSQQGSASGVAQLQQQVEAVGSELTSALRSLLEHLPGAAESQSRLSEATGLNRNSASKVTIALAKPEPLAALHALPGPEALRKLLQGAKRRRLPAAHGARLASAIDRYQRLISADFRDKPALDAAIAGWLPDTRDRVEAANRHLVYKGMSALHGVSAETVFTLGIIAPSTANHDRCDALLAYGSIGLRRLIPGGYLRLVSIRHDTPPVRYETIDGREIQHRPLDCLVPEFSTTPLPNMREVRYDDKTVWAVPDGHVAFDSPLDLVFAEVGIANAPKVPLRDRRVGIWHVVTQPARRVVVDLFVHRDVWQGLESACTVYQTAEHGSVNLNDRTRDIDQLPIAARVIDLGRGVDAAGVTKVRRYREMLTRFFAHRGWDPALFRGRRVESTYPVHSAQYALFFESPR